ncbi:MAG: DHA2 family efflux MFS transporter permease subunit [Thermomicrobiales bacterium]|nr:MAG: DHA2 family efflux MFS transporter permease subunit [Thermomicrobiales bacterium]
MSSQASKGTASTAVAATPQQFTHRQIQVILIGLMSGMLLAALDQSIVGTALPRIVSDLGGLNQLAWVVTAYLLTSTASTPLWGKISDLYGRRLIFQVTIVIFLIGSALCGLAMSMPQLIIFRAIQGVGGGGLMAIAFAIIGDVIPARERGRYTGYFGAVWGFSSLAGPLLGGWITDNLSWRWIFYINLPIGILALVVTSIVLKMPVIKRDAKIDYLGAATIVGAVTSLLLYLNWAGEHFGWRDPSALALVAVAIVLTVAFIFAEQRAVEPIIPLRLFKNPIFSVGNAFGFLIGFAIFGGAIYLPLYLQTVKGMSPTESGLAMLPMVAGMFSMSIVSGQLITRTGKYKIYPIIGSVILIAALFLLSTLQVDTPYWHTAIFALMFGTGLGLAMMTIVTPVQNSVDPRDMGVATSATTFSRSLGGAIGAALFGAIMGIRLTHYLSEMPDVVSGALPVGEVNTSDISAIHALREPLKTEVLTAFTSAVTDVFLYAIPIIIVALIVVLFLKEIPLRTTAPILEEAREDAVIDELAPITVH